MFNTGFPKRWSTLRKLLCLRIMQGAAAVLETVTGTLPLTIANAISKAIVSLTRYGLCTQASTPTPSAPVDIKCNNGAIRYGVISKNLFDASAVEDENRYINANTGKTATPGSGQFRYSAYIPVTGGVTYFFGITPFTASSAGMAWYSEPDVTVGGRSGTWLSNNGMKDTAPTGATLVRFSIRIDSGFDTNWQNTVYFCKDGDLSSYEPYREGIYTDGTPEVLTVTDEDSNAQTASVVDLFAVGDYADTQEIISGAVTRKCGIEILTGEESGWALSDSGTTHRFRGTKPSDCHTPASRAPSVCTHFKYVSTGSAVGGMFIGASQYWYFIPTDQTIDTVDGWTAWLKEQYAQGTPVIVIYPLAEATTESVAGQALHTVAGTNTVSVTAEVSPVALTCEYYQSAA